MTAVFAFALPILALVLAIMFWPRALPPPPPPADINEAWRRAQKRRAGR